MGETLAGAARERRDIASGEVMAEKRLIRFVTSERQGRPRVLLVAPGPFEP